MNIISYIFICSLLTYSIMRVYYKQICFPVVYMCQPNAYAIQYGWSHRRLLVFPQWWRTHLFFPDGLADLFINSFFLFLFFLDEKHFFFIPVHFVCDWGWIPMEPTEGITEQRENPETTKDPSQSEVAFKLIHHRCHACNKRQPWKRESERDRNLGRERERGGSK